MVSLSLGARWQAKVEEVANLKLEKQELTEELKTAKEEVGQLRKALMESEEVNETLGGRLRELVEKQGSAESVTKMQETSVSSLYSQLSAKSAHISSLESSLHSLQSSHDSLSRQLTSTQSLVSKLQSEIAQGDGARARVETERDGWKAQFEKKGHDLELVLRAKEHCEKHIAILVKEKDRLLGKKPEVSPVLSAQYAGYEVERPMTAPKPDSFNELEVLRLRKSVSDLKAQLANKDEELEKAKKENWGLITRLRNARK